MPQGTKETIFIISDLCCSTEEFKIRKKLESLPEIDSLQFNLVSHKLTVCHGTDEQKIQRALKDIGLPGFIENAVSPATEKKALRNQVIAVAGSSSLLTFGGVLSLLHAPLILTHSLFLLAIALGGWQIAAKALRSVKNLSLDINFLMTVAVIGAVIIGEYAEGAAVIVLYALSLLLESKSMDRSRRAIQSLINLSPPTTTVLREGKELIVPVEKISVGEMVVIRPGERIGLDGVVAKGLSSVDQAPITGESLPVAKRQGDLVFAGSFNKHGALEVQVTKSPKDSTLARIIHLVEDAQSKKAPSQTFVERFAQVYTPAVFILAIGVATIPPILFNAPFSDWFYRALVLLVIACPCALVISTPITVVSAITNATKHGMLFKGGKHLEALAGVRAVAFDKTGTLTEGKPTVTDIVNLNSISSKEILRIAAAAEMKSEHHLADAFLQKAEEEGIVLDDIATESFASLTGKGVRTTIDGKTYIVGSHQLIEELGVCSPAVEHTLQHLEDQGKTVVLLADEKQVLGVIGIADRVREESHKTVKSLHTAGVERVVLLTGDNQGTAASVAEKLGVDEVRAELLPEEKLTAVQQLKAHYRSVAMVGDGINDAPALAAADVGIAMGGIGSDTALETADIVLMSDNIAKIPFGIDLGKKSFRIIKQNIALALVTKLIFLGLGIFGMTSLWLAILADDGATLVVILNGLRVLKMK